MYGYAFGAAEVGVDHVVTHGIVAYPSEVRIACREEEFARGGDGRCASLSYDRADARQRGHARTSPCSAATRACRRRHGEKSPTSFTTASISTCAAGRTARHQAHR
eukprot:6193320-Pleurochrysis_carterae.AAC.1